MTRAVPARAAAGNRTFSMIGVGAALVAVLALDGAPNASAEDRPRVRRGRIRALNASPACADCP
ncbi:hypothetical protein ABT024_15730 [Streptomyces sp. NPDC002812]|uniref:hypothetical protein n=1 Tax=Streptomyces sp. NPDC002812 TaxID=3154434 RepID=UPI00332370E9